MTGIQCFQRFLNLLFRFSSQQVFFIQLPKSVIYNYYIHQKICMRFFLFILITLLAQLASFQIVESPVSKLAIRAGIAGVNLGSNNQATVTITYSSKMPDSDYNYVTSMAQIINYKPLSGLIFSANCNSAQTQLNCDIVVESTSNNTLLYLTFVVSDQPDFIVGSLFTTLTLNSHTLSTYISTQIALPSDSPFKVSRNVVNFIKVISGIESLDRDFVLIFTYDQNFDLTTSTVQFQVLISEFQQPSLNITFGYMLFLADRYSLNIIPEMWYLYNKPSSNKNIIYVISQINNITSLDTVTNPFLPTPNETNLFQRLFTITGFSLIVNTTSSDPIITLQLDPYVSFMSQPTYQPVNSLTIENKKDSINPN